ncbi:MAG: alpha/beta hydrolase [Propionibacteriaceae bacterium]|nr:alpha/beta hydrolase [Micropruina sp.]
MPELSVTGRHPATLHYTDAGGDGRPVVLIHGWPLSGDMWAGAVAALSAAGYRPITYDRRGFGRSSKPEGGYNFEQFTADLSDLVEHLDLHDAVLVGFSMGGGEVATYVDLYGDLRLSGLVFAGSITPHLCITDDDPDGAMPSGGFEGMMDWVAKDRDAFLDMFVRLFYSISTDDGSKLLADEQTVQAGLAITAQAGDTALFEGIRTWMDDFRNALPKVSLPTLVVHGTGDQNVPFAAAAPRTFSAIPTASLVAIEGAPHGMHVTHAGEFEGALLAFLAGLG